ncbi:MAG TPA: four helix bundle protein [Candidatus Kryptonia bacterium]
MKVETERKSIKTYRDLIVWQKSISFVTDIYKMTKCFPKDEQFGLISQMRRCSVSVPSNIAEGYGRRSTGDYVRFLRIAMGSTFEIQTQLQIASNLNYLGQCEFDVIHEKSRELERMLSALLSKLN